MHAHALTPSSPDVTAAMSLARPRFRETTLKALARSRETLTARRNIGETKGRSREAANAYLSL
jgi:hypothetical protein